VLTKLARFKDFSWSLKPHQVTISLTKRIVCDPPFVVYKDGCPSLSQSPGLVHCAYREPYDSNYNPLISGVGEVELPYACSSSSTSLLSILTFPAPPVQSLAVQFIMVAIKLLEELSTLPSDIPASGKSERRTRYYSLFITVKRYHVQVSEKKAFQNDTNATPMLALHSTSFQKEIWEPTLEALFQVLEETNDSQQE